MVCAQAAGRPLTFKEHSGRQDRQTVEGAAKQGAKVGAIVRQKYFGPRQCTEENRSILGRLEHGSAIERQNIIH